MVDAILLDDLPYHVDTNQLPCIITYGEKTGGSHFSITLIATYFSLGKKVILFTGYPMAKDNFLQQVQGLPGKILYISNLDDLSHLRDVQAIIVESSNQQLFFDILDTLEDIDDRIVLVKNMEIFERALIERCLGLSKIIFSGDIDLCSHKNSILSKEHATTIVFSPPITSLGFYIPSLQKYEGYLSSVDGNNGIVSVDITY